MSKLYYIDENNYDFVQHEYINGIHYLVFDDHIGGDTEKSVIVNANTTQFTKTFDSIFEVAENVDNYDWFNLKEEELKSVGLLVNFAKDGKKTLEDILIPALISGLKRPWEV